MMRSERRAAWAIPVAGFFATWLIVAGFSLSNQDIRSQAEIGGLIVLAIFPAVGLVWARRAHGPLLALAINLLLAILVVSLAVVAYLARRPLATAPRPATTATAHAAREARTVWIDTDPACGSGKTADVDDCWALALALRSPELRVRAISTTFGNAPPDGTLSSAQRVRLVRDILARADLIEKHGFSPFDAAAVGQAALPELFSCREMRARIGFSVFLAPFGLGRDLEVEADSDGVPVSYCDTVDTRFKAMLLERLRH